ncbi:hypothetical protein [Cellulophaga baltica]|uniref:TonB-dependent receptor plug domain-containing protein n=1 Tax=Cellulophaga baltica 18 TaxID=1348584 RepID=A0AAU8S446_9FLAO|nr:hypothetical protein [Cellulophaga baltica]AIZ42739.1 hypothetical protein M666_14860 [Cellulophaga baltica 18]
MFSKIYCQYLIFFLITLSANSQVISTENSADLKKLKNIGNESVELHYSNSTVLSGEVFFYKFYCKNSKGEPSNISKIGYVELINKDLEIVIRQKIHLENGNGYNDFFIPTNLKTDGYKLIAYTNWMKNNSVSNFFQEDIVIINPFSNRSKIPDSTLFLNSVKAIELPSKTTLKSHLILSLEKQFVNTREKLKVNLETKNKEFLEGEYSLLIKKKNNFHVQKYASNSLRKNKQKSSEFYFPELRGQLISGTIQEVGSGHLLPNKNFTFNIPGNNYQLYTFKTNSNGQFILDYRNSSEIDFALLQPIGKSDEKIEINLDTHKNLDYSSLDFIEIKIDSTLKDLILARSIHNQIENAYYNAKPDTIVSLPLKKAFYGDLGVKYILDDFTRFPSFKETIVEIIDNVWISEDKKGKYELKIKSYGEQFSEGDYDPLIIIDGVRLNSIEGLISYNTQNIKSVTVVRDKYILGANIFSGIIDIKTFQGDFGRNEDYFGLTKLELNAIAPRKKYFQQKHLLSDDRIPDYRHILYWNPEFKMNSVRNDFSFYSSDVKGTFVIQLRGFSSSGTPIEIEEEFTVQ